MTEAFKIAFSGKGEDRCSRQTQPSDFHFIAIYLAALVQPVEKHLGSLLAQPCPAIDTVTPDVLNHLLPRDGQAASAPERSYGDAFIKDRIVLLGVDLPQAGDRFDSPTAGNVPGVYVHAVAVENLLDRGSGFHPSRMNLPAFIAIFLIDALAYHCLKRVWGAFLDSFGRMGAIGDVVLAPLVYLLFAFIVSFVLFSFIDNQLPFIPLAHVAVPLIAIHLIMFVEWGERVKHHLLLPMEQAVEHARLPAWLSRRLSRPAGSDNAATPD